MSELLEKGEEKANSSSEENNLLSWGKDKKNYY